MSLFGNNDDLAGRPLADRMRPKTLDGYIGQHHLLGEGKPLRQAIASGHPHSMIFWGPPGTGKTTLGKLIAGYCDMEFITISAVLAGVKEVRAAVARAQQLQQEQGRRTLLFIALINHNKMLFCLMLKMAPLRLLVQRLKTHLLN